MVLELKNICKSYGEKDAVKNFSIELYNGIYGLLGANGAGKTTLMKIIVDILNQTSGEILVDGVSKNSMGDNYRGLIGYLPQELGIYKNFTAYDFLMYMAALKGIEGKEAKAKVAELLEITNLKESINVKCGKLSGGMKRRLGIAQALINDPKILILDEPTVGLDPNERIKFRNMISNISREKIVLISTHIVSDIEFIAKKVLIFKKGQLINNETVGNLISSIDNKVWMAKVNADDIAQIQSDYIVSNMNQKENGIEVRIIDDNKPFDGAECVKANFEEVYLYYFNYRK
ncbi:MAG: ABC transporter ATP-binding protein [Clostridium sp.]